MPIPTLTSDERRLFDRDGYVLLRGAFAPSDAQRMQAEWWAELAEDWGVVRGDPSTWRQPRGDLKRPKTAPSERLFETDAVRRVIDGVLGAGAWDWPRNWGRAVLTFPSGKPPETWDVPPRLWHWDGRIDWNAERPQNVQVFAFVGEAKPAGGGTLVLAGSPTLVRRQYASLTPAQRAYGGTWQRDRFWRLDPWLAGLTGQAPSPGDRKGAFLREGGEVDGVPVRVVELTGEPGDVYFCDPLMAHCVAPNCRQTPRMMRIAMLASHATRRLVKEEVERSKRRETHA